MHGVPTLMAASHFILTVTVAMLVMKLVTGHGDLAGNNGPPPPPQQRRLFDVLGRVQLMLGGLGSGPPLGLVPGHPPPPPAAGAPLPAAPGPHGVLPKQLYEEVFDVLDGLAVSEVNDLLSHAHHPLRLFGCLADDNEHDFHHGGSNRRAARGQCIICGLLYTFHMRELRLKVFRTRRCCQ